MVLCVALFCACLSALHGQSILRGKANFSLMRIFARFYGDESQVYVEVVLRNSTKIRFRTARPGLSAERENEAHGTVRVVDRRDKEWLVPHEIPDSLRMASMQILTGIESVALPKGSYSAHLYATDVNDPASRTFSVGLPVTYYPKTTEGMSDLELWHAYRSRRK